MNFTNIIDTLNFDTNGFLKFIYSEKATKCCEISTLPLTTVHTVKNKVEITQNFVAFSEYMNFIEASKTKAEAVASYKQPHFTQCPLNSSRSAILSASR